MFVAQSIVDDRSMLYCDHCDFVSSDSQRQLQSTFNECLIDHLRLVSRNVRNRRSVSAARRNDDNRKDSKNVGYDW